MYYPQVSQAEVDAVTADFYRNHSIKPGMIRDSDWKILHNFVWSAGGLKIPKVPQIFTDCASTSKVLLDWVVGQLVALHPNNSLPATTELLVELVGRNSDYFLNTGLYKALWQTVEDSLELNEGIREHLEQEFERWLQSNQLMIPVSELRHQMIVFSGNEATRILKEWAVDLLGGMDNLQKEVDRISPNTVNLTITLRGGYHWIQRNSNTGNPLLIGAFLHNKALNPRALQPWENDWLKRMENNPQPVGFDLTTSQFGQELIEKGYIIRSKTGFNPVNYWQGDLATKSHMPTHMSMMEVAQIIPPHGNTTQITTMAQVMLVEVSAPTAQVEYPGMVKGVLFPDEFEPSYEAYLKSVEAQIAPKFRANMRMLWGSTSPRK